MISALIFVAGFAAGVVFTVAAALCFLHYASDLPDNNEVDRVTAASAEWEATRK
jgi:hypothetical protein